MRDARAHRDIVIQVTEQALHRTRRAVEQSHVEIRASALLALRDGRERAAQQFLAIRHDSLLKLEQARHAVPATMAEIAALARQTLHEARQGAAQHHANVIERGAQQAALARDRTRQALDQVAEAARRQVLDARTWAAATLREIAGQGPEKTLGRGFAVVRSVDGVPLTDAAAACAAGDLQLEFRDGRLPARVRTEEGTRKT